MWHILSSYPVYYVGFFHTTVDLFLPKLILICCFLIVRGAGWGEAWVCLCLDLNQSMFPSLSLATSYLSACQSQEKPSEFLPVSKHICFYYLTEYGAGWWYMIGLIGLITFDPLCVSLGTPSLYIAPSWVFSHVAGLLLAFLLRDES